MRSKSALAAASALIALTGCAQGEGAAASEEPSYAAIAPGDQSEAAQQSAELMRSHFLNRLTNQQAEEYLAEDDIIFVGVGPTEMHGGFPLDAETVVAEAFALKMAEEMDALALGGLPFLYSGGTAMGQGTVQLGARESSDLVHSTAHSLNRQGFKRQVYVSFHGPTHYLVSPALRDFFDETMTPAQYVDLTKVLFDDPSVLEGENFYTIFLGAYDILGRLDDVPLTTSDHDHSQPADSSVDFVGPLNDLAPQSGATGYYFGEQSDHGVTPELLTAEDRQQMADAGVEVIDRIIENMDVQEMVRLMEELATMQGEMDAEHLPGIYNQQFLSPATD